MNRLLLAGRRCRTEAWPSATLDSTAASCRCRDACSPLQRCDLRASAAFGAVPATLQLVRSATSISASMPIQQARTLGELLESCRHAVDAGGLTSKEVGQLAKDKKALLVSSWRSVFGLRRDDLCSAPLEVLEVFLDAMLTEEFAVGVGKQCRVLVHDQTAVLRALHDRDDCRRLADSHRLVPILVYNVVEHLDSLDFGASLGDELYDVCTMLLVYLCQFHKNEKMRRTAIQAVFTKISLHARASAEATLKMLQLFGAIHHAVEPWTGGHLLACAEHHLSRPLAAGMDAQLRLALIALSDVSVSFVRLALHGITDDVLQLTSTEQCCTLLLAAEGSADLAWTMVLPKCGSLPLLEVLLLLDKVLTMYREAQIDQAQFRERAAVLLHYCSDAVMQPELNCTVGDILLNGPCLIQLRGHPAVRKLAGQLQAHFVASATSSPMCAEELAKLAYFFSLLSVDLSPQLFPDASELSLDPSLVCSEPPGAEQSADSAAEEGAKEAVEPAGEWSDGWHTL